MELDSIVTLKSHPIELEVAFSIGTIFNVADISNGVEGSLPIQVPTPIKVRAHFDDTIDPTLSSRIVKNEHMVLVIGTSMKGLGV
jgi:hypothetical protein